MAARGRACYTTLPRRRSMRSVALLALAVACAPKQRESFDAAEAPATEGLTSPARAEGDALWEQRDDRDMLVEALARYEIAIATDARDRHVGERLARGYYFLGDAYETQDDARIAAWDQSIAWGKRCLAINAQIAALLAKGDETEATAIRAATIEDVPCLFWTATAIGRWSRLKGPAATLAHVATVKAYITRVEDLDPDFYYRAADRYWGAYYAVIPSFAGKDLTKSKEHFDKALEHAPGFVGTKVLLAEFWAVEVKDRATFVTSLNEVLAADENVVPEIRPEVLAEKRKAAALLAREDELFPK
jgi:tetratricopeptide (TPR) repeat protein